MSSSLNTIGLSIRDLYYLFHALMFTIDKTHI